MEINVAKITKIEGAEEKFDITDAHNQFDIDFCGEKLKTVSPIHVKGKAVNYEGTIKVDMNVQAKVERQCGRCLEPFTEDIQLETEYAFAKQLQPSDEDVYLYKGDTIDITDLVLGEIAAELTMKPLCNEECKGLCPICGNNKNLASCQCKNDQIDSRLQILSKLLETKQGGV